MVCEVGGIGPLMFPGSSRIPGGDLYYNTIPWNSTGLYYEKKVKISIDQIQSI